MIDLFSLQNIIWFDNGLKYIVNDFTNLYRSNNVFIIIFIIVFIIC